MRKSLDAILDIITIAILVFTVIVTVDKPITVFLLTVMGCGALFNNVKYIYDKKKQKSDDAKYVRGIYSP